MFAAWFWRMSSISGGIILVNVKFCVAMVEFSCLYNRQWFSSVHFQCIDLGPDLRRIPAIFRSISPELFPGYF